MSRGQFKKKKQARKAAKKKVPEKFAQAVKNPDQNTADRLIRRARRLAMKFRMSLQPYKHTYCKHCYTRLAPNNSRVRVHGGKVITYCMACKKYKRIPVRKKVRG